jgi:hypothetical protein
VVTEERKLQDHAVILRPGVEFTALLPGKKRKARMSFRRYVTTATGAWVEAWDGRMTRSVHAEAVLTVHRTRKMAAGTRAVDIHGQPS